MIRVHELYWPWSSVPTYFPPISSLPSFDSVCGPIPIQADQPVGHQPGCESRRRCICLWLLDSTYSRRFLADSHRPIQNTRYGTLHDNPRTGLFARYLRTSRNANGSDKRLLFSDDGQTAHLLEILTTVSVALLKFRWIKHHLLLPSAPMIPRLSRASAHVCFGCAGSLSPQLGVNESEAHLALATYLCSRASTRSTPPIRTLGNYA